MYASALLSIQNLWSNVQTVRSLTAVKRGRAKSAQPLTFTLGEPRFVMEFVIDLTGK